jgi:hypothetical protein
LFELKHSGEKHTEVTEDLHLFIEFIVNFTALQSTKIASYEAGVHTFKALRHGLDSTGVQMLEEVKLTENRQVVVP